MGNLLNIFGNKSNASSLEKLEVYLDFENVQPSETESAIYNLVMDGMVECNDILSSLSAYSGCEEKIRIAMQQPSNDEAKETVWDDLTPLIVLLNKCYNLCQKMESFLPNMLVELCGGNDVIQNFENKQALAKAFSQVLDFSMKFDANKLKKPYIQNDFAFYRRCINRSVTTSSGKLLIIDEVHGEIVNNILLFLACPCPFMSKISDLTIRHFSKSNNPNIIGVCDAIGILCSICQFMVENPHNAEKLKNEEMKNFFCRVCAVLIVLYDNIHPTGVFLKGSKIDIKNKVKFIKDQKQELAVSLLNIIRYSSKHFNDVNIPSSVKQLFDI